MLSVGKRCGCVLIKSIRKGTEGVSCEEQYGLKKRTALCGLGVCYETGV